MRHLRPVPDEGQHAELGERPTPDNAHTRGWERHPHDPNPQRRYAWCDTPDLDVSPAWAPTQPVEVPALGLTLETCGRCGRPVLPTTTTLAAHPFATPGDGAGLGRS